mmetsp:Transcript_7387/g.20956  ORF Transcript_7387/g.20956 Transcript_7387/m.20956 type:complete len:681 (-) Transcript_7387:92-2134(-)
MPPAAALRLLLATALAAPPTAALTFEAKGSKSRPVSKVIALLKDMNKQLAKEAEEDEEIYDKIACWCETNDKSKTKSISDAEGRIEDLTSSVEALTAQSARLGTEIKNHEQEVAKNQEALDKATAIREKELAEFQAEEKDLLASLSALKAALVVLGKHHGTSLLQLPQEPAIRVRATMRQALQQHRHLLKGALTPSQRRAALSFIQTFDEDVSIVPAYEPQSSEIFGVLSQMKDTFEANLEQARKDEQASQKAFEDVRSGKEEEIKAGTAQVEKKSEELADIDEKNAQSKTDLDDTKGGLTVDEQFLQMLKEKCAVTDQEWEERQKMRQQEMEAVSKAMAILSGDDAHDLFGRTFNPSLVQTGMTMAVVARRRTAASDLLTQAAKRYHSPRLAALAYRARLDAFERVKQAIDELVAQHLKDKEAEIKHKDFCVEEFNTNQLKTEKRLRQQDDFKAKVADLEGSVKAHTESVDALKAEIAEMQVQLKRAGEDREKQHNEFQLTVSDQRETARLLTAALKVLGDFYGDAPSAAFEQVARDSPPPPAGFDKYGKNEQGGNVMGMLQQIISDAKEMEAAAVRAENEAQQAYEEFVKETNASIEAKGKDVVNKSEAKAKAEAELVSAKESLEATGLELEQLANEKAELHQGCDFILKTFDVRQTARDEEVEALKQAKAILSGARD